MPNPLTGDFDAVLQISGGTLNRLMASMHQNAFENPKLPSFPHSVRMRIGDDHAYEGVRGLAHAQVSVPTIELVHGATDRFILQVSVRAWYRPDPGTEPLPAYINGIVRAEYRLHDIDPSCPGYSQSAADYLWFRVVRDSVEFRGTAVDDVGFGDMVAIPSSDPDAIEAANLAKVTRQIARLLAKRFEATPHKVSKRFRRGSMRSLNNQGGSAIALPLGLQGDPWGNVHTIDNVLLNGTDLAVAVSVNYMMGLAAKMVQPLASFSQQIYVKVTGPFGFTEDTTYTVGVHPPSVQWFPQGTYAIFKVRISGWANSPHLLFPNVTFDIDQDIVLNFGGGSLWLSPGSLNVNPHAGGPFGGMVEDQVRPRIIDTVKPIVETACNNATPGLNSLTKQTGELSDRLKSLDAGANAALHWAEFVPDGMVLRGRIALSPRRSPVILQEKTAAGDAHSALQTWIPGGRISKFEWSWTWSDEVNPQNKTHADRFLLRRPKGKSSRWGVALGVPEPLPGLDGWGKVCLKVYGEKIDEVTGQFVDAFNSKKCVRFGFDLGLVYPPKDRLHFRDMPELSQDVPFPQLKERALVAVRQGGNNAANTLVLYAGEEWSDETANALGKGLEDCRRYDAGLAVLILFKEGVLDHHGPRLTEAVLGHVRRFGIMAHVNEDVNGGWSRTLDLCGGGGEPGLALISPEGTVPWRHRGRLEPETLATALDTHLRRSPDLSPPVNHDYINVGYGISAAALTPGFADILDSAVTRCPPVPLGRLGKDTVITFVQQYSEASISHSRSLMAQYGQQEGGPHVVVVVDGADPRETERWQHQLGLDFTVLPDPKGTITNRFRIGVWPTTITVNADSIVSDVRVGHTPRGRGEYVSERSEQSGKGGATAV
ncbi:MAG: hypothetical protein HC861_06270 [Rhodospirillaceae bacterium]|nr:hypothetical protein [Rhodospirillaceae bacterium]